MWCRAYFDLTDRQGSARYVVESNAHQPRRLIGWPDSNTLVERFRKNLHITFGSRSFVVRGKTYAHPGSAVVAAAENPLNRRLSLVVLAGLSSEATVFAPHTAAGRRIESISWGRFLTGRFMAG